MNNRLSHILFRRRPKSPDAATYLSILSILYIWSLKPSHIYIVLTPDRTIFKIQNASSSNHAFSIF